MGKKWSETSSVWQPKTNIGIRATAKEDLWPMSDNYIPVKYAGFRLLIPEPEAYVIHKILINKTREEKIGTDRERIRNLFPLLDKERFKSIYSKCRDSERARINTFFRGILGYPSVDYYLSVGEQNAIPYEKIQIVEYAYAEIIEVSKEHEQAKEKFKNQEITKKELDRSREIKRHAIEIACQAVHKTGLSKDKIWLVKKNLPFSTSDKQLAEKAIAQLYAKILQEENAQKKKNEVLNNKKKTQPKGTEDSSYSDR